MQQLDLIDYIQRYPHVPAARRTDTSIKAAEDMRSSACTIRAQVLASIRARGEHGATSKELAELLNLPYEAVQPRTSELRKQGKIVDSGLRRASRAEDKQAIVWVNNGK